MRGGTSSWEQKGAQGDHFIGTQMGKCSPVSTEDQYPTLRQPCSCDTHKFHIYKTLLDAQLSARVCFSSPPRNGFGRKDSLLVGRMVLSLEMTAVLKCPVVYCFNYTLTNCNISRWNQTQNLPNAVGDTAPAGRVEAVRVIVGKPWHFSQVCFTANSLQRVWCVTCQRLLSHIKVVFGSFPAL